MASLARQIGRCYSSNRRATKPVRLILANWSNESPLAEECRRVNSGFDNYQVRKKEKSFPCNQWTTFFRLFSMINLFTRVSHPNIWSTWVQMLIQFWMNSMNRVFLWSVVLLMTVFEKYSFFSPPLLFTFPRFRMSPIELVKIEIFPVLNYPLKLIWNIPLTVEHSIKF